MFDNKEIAEKVNKVMLDVSAILDESITVISESSCSDDEKTAYYKVVGQLMGIISVNVLNAIYRVHSDLKPKEYLLPEEFKQ